MCLFIYLHLCFSAGFNLAIVLFNCHFNENFVIIIIIIIIVILCVLVYYFFSVLLCHSYYRPTIY